MNYAPGMIDLAVGSSSIPIDRYSAETLALAKESIENLRGRTSDLGGRSETR